MRKASAVQEHGGRMKIQRVVGGEKSKIKIETRV